MTLRHIQIFISVCDTGSTVKASKQLNLAQPSISLGIKEIETNYGIKLFDRISRKLVLTEAGENFLVYAREINNSFNNLETQIKDYDKTKKLSIGASITIGIFILPLIIKKFKESYPTTELTIVIKDSVSIADMVVENKLDFGFIESNNSLGLYQKQIHSTPFYKDKLVLAVSKDHPLAIYNSIKLKQLEGQQLILRESDSAGRNLIDKVLFARNIKLPKIWESVSNSAIISMVSENLGITILPNGVINNHSQNHRIKQITIQNVAFDRTYSIIHHKNKYLTKGAKDLIKIAKDFTI